MSTYSIGTPPTDADKLADLQSIFNELPDNTSKLISPKKVRDSIYSLWENIAFKPTTVPSSVVEYIGIDQSSLKEKIFLGKKQVSGQYVMNSDLLSSDVDIFLFNTKSEPSANNNTKIAIIAGTSSNFKGGDLNAPYLEVDVVSTLNGEYLNLNVVNPSYTTSGLTNYGGDINILSENGSVSANGIILPSYLNNQDSGNDGYGLIYRWNSGIPEARWEQLSTQSISTASNVYFTDALPVPITIGGILAGETFSNVPIETILRRLLYPYIAPTISISLSSDLIESGSTMSVNTLTLLYTTDKKSSTASAYLSTVVGGVSGSYISPVPVGITSGYVFPILNNTSTPSSYAYNLSGTQSWVSYTWSIAVSDLVGPTSTSSDNLGIVIPWYYGSATISATSSGSLNGIIGTSSIFSLGKLTPSLNDPIISATSSSNKSYTLRTSFGGSNQGYLYFGYPNDFPDLVSIEDPNGYDVIGSFQKYTVSGLSSPNLWWSGKQYKFYIYVGAGSTPSLTTIGTYPTYSGVYKFNFV